nr:hypothetical protein [uncultured Undibacterium sp.]
MAARQLTAVVVAMTEQVENGTNAVEHYLAVDALVVLGVNGASLEHAN